MVNLRLPDRFTADRVLEIFNYINVLMTPTVSTPVISPSSGTFLNSQEVTITCSTSSVEIHYTTNDTEPTIESAIYTAPFTITENSVIRAIAVKENYNNSVEATARTYTLVTETVATPSISPASGYFYPTQEVTISCSTQDAIIHYTIDNTEPTVSSTTYSAPFTVSATRTIRAIAVKEGYLDSSEATARTYTIISETVATPTISPDQAAFVGSVEVSITCNTSASSIYYTTNGDTPTISSTHYTAPFTVSNDCTVKAIAVKTNMFDSLVGEQAYAGSMQFTHSGQTFQPIITVTGTPTITWTYADETTSNLAAPPVKDFGTASTRNTLLTVTPWSAVTRINVGYDGGDGGDRYNTDTTALAQQNVTAIQGLPLVRTSLQKIAVNNNPITALDFTNFTALEVIECYYCTSLTTGIVTGCSALKRLCFEHCHLTSLDLSTNPLLEDLRSAGQGRNGYSINWGNTGEYVWHICTVDNNNMIMPINYANFPSLTQLWTWNDGLTGPLTNLSSTVNSIACAGNSFSDIDLSNWVGVGEIILTNGGYSTALVDKVLKQLDEGNRSNSSIGLTGNNGPSMDYHINNLRARGWTVNTDAVLHTTVEPPVFGTSQINFEEAFDLTLTCPTADAIIHYTLDGSTPTASSTTYTASIAISATTTIRALAVKAGMTTSEIVEKTYYFVAPTDFTIWNRWQQFHYGGGGDLVSAPINVTAGHAIIVFGNSQGGTLSVSDTQGNTYTSCGTQGALSNDPIRGGWFYTFAEETGANTITLNHTDGFYGMSIIECSGIDSSDPVDLPTLTSTGVQSTPFSTTNASDVIFAGYHVQGTITGYVQTPGYTLLIPESAYATGSGPDRQTEYRVVGQIQTNAHVAMTGSTNMMGNWVVAFKLSSTVDQVADPEFTPAAQYFTEDFNAEITCDTPGSTIYYTVNNTQPTTESSQYTTAIPISDATTTVRAIATATDFITSEEASVTYTYGEEPNIALVQNRYVNGDDPLSMNVTAGNLLLVHCHSYGGNSHIITDTDTNTYTVCGEGSAENPGVYTNFLWAYVGGTGTHSVTLNWTHGGSYLSWGVSEWSGFTAIDPVDVHTLSAAGSTSGTITTTNPNDMIVVCWHVESGNVNPIAGTGYTLLSDGTNETGTWVYRPVEYKLVSNTVSETATLTLGLGGTVMSSWAIALKTD